MDFFDLGQFLTPRLIIMIYNYVCTSKLTFEKYEYIFVFMYFKLILEVY